jgi:hypothetical protein
MEENKPEGAPKKEFLQKVDKDKALAYGFLVFLGLVAFNFGGSKYTYIFSAVGILIAIGFLGIISLKLQKNDKKALFFYGLPLIIFAIFSSFSKFWLSESWSSVSTGAINLVGILAFFAIGYLSKNVKYVSLKGILIALVIGFSFLALISLIASLCDYGPFYAIRYSNGVYYQDGVGYTVSNEYAMLFGFRIAAVSIRYGLFYAFMSAASLSGLLFISPKEDKALFLTIAIGGGVGLLALLLVPYWVGLLLLLPVYVLAVLLRYVKFPKATPLWEKIVAWVLAGLAFVLLLIVFVNGIKDIPALNKGALGHLFNNGRYLLPINEIIQAMFWGEIQIGGTTHVALDLSALYGMSFNDSGVWEGVNFLSGFFIKNRVFEFAVLYEGGLIAFLALLVLLAFAIIALRKYLHSEEKISGEKIVVVSLLLAYLVYQSLEMDSYPILHANQSPVYVSPVFQNAAFLLMVLLLGVSYQPIFKVKTAVVPEANVHED